MWFFDLKSISYFYWDEVLKISKQLKISNNKNYFLTEIDLLNIESYLNKIMNINVQQKNILFMTKKNLELKYYNINLKTFAYDSFYKSLVDWWIKAFENTNFIKEEKILEDLFWY